MTKRVYVLAAVTSGRRLVVTAHCSILTCRELQLVVRRIDRQTGVCLVRVSDWSMVQVSTRTVFGVKTELLFIR